MTPLAFAFGLLLWVAASLVIAAACHLLKRALNKPAAPKRPTWVDVHAKTAGTTEDEYLIVRTPRAVHCMHLPTETERFVQSIYEQADRESQS